MPEVEAKLPMRYTFYHMRYGPNPLQLLCFDLFFERGSQEPRLATTSQSSCFAFRALGSQLTLAIFGRKVQKQKTKPQVPISWAPLWDSLLLEDDCESTSFSAFTHSCCSVAMQLQSHSPLGLRPLCSQDLWELSSWSQWRSLVVPAAC